jgi:hypothetical protein
MAERRSDEALTAVLRGSAVPYGYTLTVLAAHSILASRHGGPDVAEILVFVVGAILAFASLGLFAQARGAKPLPTRGGDVIRAGMIHALAIGVAFGAATLVALIPGIAAWPLGAYVATVLYLWIASLEIDFASRIDD